MCEGVSVYSSRMHIAWPACTNMCPIACCLVSLRLLLIGVVAMACVATSTRTVELDRITLFWSRLTGQVNNSRSWAGMERRTRLWR